MEDILIRFQIFLNDKGLITNHDWDYEKLAKQFIRHEKKHQSNRTKDRKHDSVCMKTNYRYCITNTGCSTFRR